MNKESKTLRFLREWRSAIIAFPTIMLYCGFIPLLKTCGIVEVSWLWALCPIWIPFIAFWTIVSFISCIALVTEIGFLILPDEDLSRK